MHGEVTGDYLSTVSSVKPAGPPPPPTTMAVHVARVVLPHIVSWAAKKTAQEAKTAAPQTTPPNPKASQKEKKSRQPETGQ